MVFSHLSPVCSLNYSPDFTWSAFNFFAADRGWPVVLNHSCSLIIFFFSSWFLDIYVNSPCSFPATWKVVTILQFAVLTGNWTGGGASLYMEVCQHGCQALGAHHETGSCGGAQRERTVTAQRCYSSLLRTCSWPRRALEVISWCFHWRWRWGGRRGAWRQQVSSPLTKAESGWGTTCPSLRSEDPHQAPQWCL